MSSHPGIFHVRKGDSDSFTSALIADQAFEKGQVIVNLEGLTPGPKRYSSVQISPTEHVELNSDLLYLNHSCDPTTFLDVNQLSLKALKPLNVGDELTFFYPSTEWDIAQQFDCWCGSPKCIKVVKGAKYLPTEVLEQFELSQHIKDLLSERGTI
ncbi:hypothetical protein BJ944DRAFT_263758 [Cunninghamella echinulata]|nr:hypothetical protein BJ944DRAFT_263758 [Cunninghamella echinulata]